MGKLSSLKVFEAWKCLFMDCFKQNIIQPPEFSETGKMPICCRLRFSISALTVFFIFYTVKEDSS